MASPWPPRASTPELPDVVDILARVFLDLQGVAVDREMHNLFERDGRVLPAALQKPRLFVR
jgi:hypothetical protein